jgi:hypothetical protein
MNKTVGREYYFCYEKTSKHTALKKILAVIAGNIEIELIIAAIGRKMITFHLVYMAGLIVCRKYAAMTMVCFQSPTETSSEGRLSIFLFL